MRPEEYATAKFGGDSTPKTPIKNSITQAAKQHSVPAQKFLRESVAPEPFEETLEKEEAAMQLNEGKRIEDTFKKESNITEELDQERDDDVEDRTDNDFDEEDSDRSDPFDSMSESDCLSRGSALSDFTEYADMKVEECRPSDAGAIFKLPVKNNSPDKD